MSRVISITVKFNNNKSKTFGIYNPINAEYEKSLLSYGGMIERLEQAKAYCKDKGVKRVIVTNQISTGYSSETWEKATLEYKNLEQINPCKLIDINNILYRGFIKK